ncbi:MAG TPA: glycosyltransferase [Maribacter sp.]|nr:glycosyltransferase [Maribacter sp.]
MKVYVGYDTREDIAYQVCEHSIKRRNGKTEVQALKQSDLRTQGLYTREIDKLSSTEFTFTRFLIPYLQNYKGWAVFCDCDFVWKISPRELEQFCDDSKAVVCVQHDYTPEEGTKMDGQAQLLYPRKNWSSMVLWNCGHPKNKYLTPEIVNTQSGKHLHRFSWLDDEDIGELPYEYNWLVGWYTETETRKPKILHYTEGGPWFENYRECDYADVWKKELINLFSA